VESTGGLDEHKFYTICTTFRKSECAGASPHSQSSRGSRRSSAGGGSAVIPRSKKGIKLAFKAMDTDKSGTIDCIEFLTYSVRTFGTTMDSEAFTDTCQQVRIALGSDEGSTLPRRRMDLPLASIVGGDTPRGGQQASEDLSHLGNFDPSSWGVDPEDKIEIDKAVQHLEEDAKAGTTKGADGSSLLELLLKLEQEEKMEEQSYIEIVKMEKAHMEFMQQEADLLMSFAGFDKKVI